MRRRLLAAALPLAAAAALLGPATPGQATTYAYWSYWHKAPGSSSWSYANSGPYYYRPADGSVEGWHFVHGSGGPGDPPPRVSGRYSSLCSTSPSASGVQVALVIDYGFKISKACVTVPSRSSGSAVLTKAGASQRYDSSGLLCAINGYPPSGCGSVVADPSPKPSAKPSATAAAPHRTSAPRSRSARTPAPTRRHSSSSSAATSTRRTAGAARSETAASASAPRHPSAHRASSHRPRAGASAPATAASAGPPSTPTQSPTPSPSYAPVADPHPTGPGGGGVAALAAGVGVVGVVGVAALHRARHPRR